MAAVLRLIRRSNKETVELLEWMLEQAKTERVFDVCMWFRDVEGVESAAFTGLYRADRAQALMATMRLSKHITLAQGDIYGPP